MNLGLGTSTATYGDGFPPFALILACPQANLAKDQAKWLYGVGRVSVTLQCWHMSPALAAGPAGDPGRADSSSRVSLPSTFCPDRRVLLWLRRAEEGNCGAYSPNQNSQPQTGIFLKLLLGLGFHKNHRVTALNPFFPHCPVATGTEENLEGQFQWNYSWFMLR